jgi:hypothetical protein
MQGQTQATRRDDIFFLLTGLGPRVGITDVERTSKLQGKTTFGLQNSPNPGTRELRLTPPSSGKGEREREGKQIYCQSQSRRRAWRGWR